MAAIQGVTAGYIPVLFKGPKTTGNITVATATTLTSAGNAIGFVSAMGALTKERTAITYPIYGQQTEGSLAGQAAAATFEFTVTLAMDNVGHIALRDDDGLTSYAWALKFVKGGNTTYGIFNGTLASSTVEAPIDGVINMACSVALEGGVTWVNSI